MEELFQYKGFIYNRPIGRGVILEGNLCMEDVVSEGYYEMEVVIRKADQEQARDAVFPFLKGDRVYKSATDGPAENT